MTFIFSTRTTETQGTSMQPKHSLQKSRQQSTQNTNLCFAPEFLAQKCL